jgi:bifunctional N-acetylglucosamine-1-phosphate-uridyltransferase/glucosamine-1-phosphate-acetyltransferase GlmU-like protein
MLTALSFFDLSTFSHTHLFKKNDYPWIPLNSLKEYMDKYNYPIYDSQLIKDGIPLKEHIVIHKDKAISAEDCELNFGDTTRHGLQVLRNGTELEGATVIMAGAVLSGKRISIGGGVLVECGAMIKSPAVIGDCNEVRQGAYLRGYVLTGDRCILGHTTEIKHSIFLNDAKAGHFAYLGDSILGNNANLGAGTKFANLKFLPGNVTFMYKGEKIDTGRRKFGAILGDGAQTGCNSVTSPGAILGKGSMLLPNATARAGYHPKRSVLR